MSLSLSDIFYMVYAVMKYAGYTKNVWLCSFKSKMNPGWESESLCYLGETVVVFLSEALHRYFLEHRKRCIVFCLCLSDAEQWIILSQQEVTVAD